MKRLFITLFAVFLVTFSFAQSAPKFSYQAVVRNAANELVVNDSVLVGIQFFNHTATGGAVYSEKHRVVSNRNGLISLLVGEGDHPVGNLSQVTWGDAKVRTEILLRDGHTVTDVKPVTAVPIAYYAEQIPLRAIEEHLGSTNIVSADALRDTLSHYVTAERLTNAWDDYVTVSGLMDTLSNFVSLSDYTESLNQIMAALTDLRSLTPSIEEFIVPATPANTFQLGSQPLEGRASLLYINGVCISSNAYMVANGQLRYLPNQNGGKELVAGDRIQFYYYHK